MRWQLYCWINKLFYTECKRVSGGLLLCAGSSACCTVSTAELTQSFFGMLQVSRCTYTLFSWAVAKFFRCVSVFLTGLLQSVFGLLQSSSSVVRVYFFLGLLQSFSFSLWVCNFLGLLDTKFLVSRVRTFLGLLLSLSLCGRALNRAATKRVLG